jgi:hypothetical protein
MNATTTSFVEGAESLDISALLLQILAAVTLCQQILIAEVRAGKLGILVLLIRLLFERRNAAKSQCACSQHAPPSTVTQIIYVVKKEDLPFETQKALRTLPSQKQQKIEPSRRRGKQYPLKQSTNSSS